MKINSRLISFIILICLNQNLSLAQDAGTDQEAGIGTYRNRVFFNLKNTGIALGFAIILIKVGVFIITTIPSATTGIILAQMIHSLIFPV